jgi:hypothetical protein
MTPLRSATRSEPAVPVPVGFSWMGWRVTALPPFGPNGTFAMWSGSDPISRTPSSADAISCSSKLRSARAVSPAGVVGTWDSRVGAMRLPATTSVMRASRSEGSAPEFSILKAMSTVPPRLSRTAVARSMWSTRPSYQTSVASW